MAKKLSNASTDLCLPADCTELQSLKIISSAGAVYFSRPFLFPLARTVKLSSPPLHWKKVFQGVRLLFTSLYIVLCSSTSKSVPLSGWCHHPSADKNETPSRGDPPPRRGRQDLPQHSSLVPRVAEKNPLRILQLKTDYPRSSQELLILCIDIKMNSLKNMVRRVLKQRRELYLSFPNYGMNCKQTNQ